MAYYADTWHDIFVTGSNCCRFMYCRRSYWRRNYDPFNNTAGWNCNYYRRRHQKDPTTDDKAHKDDGDTESDATTEVYTVIDAIAYEGEYLKVGASDTIPLRNNIENETTGVNLQFIIKEGDKELYVSDEVNPGEVIDWNPSKYLSAGKHNIVVTANVYHQDTGLQDVGTDMNVALEIQ